MTGIRGFKAAKTSPSSFLRRQESHFRTATGCRFEKSDTPLRR